jgi:excisionase family DNA binding protein
MTDERTPDVLSLKKAAEYLDLPESTLYLLAQRGEIPSRKVGRQWRFSRAALDEWLKGNMTPKE